MTDHAKELEADYPKFLDEVASVFNESSPYNDNVGQAMREAADELRRLQTENASLWALASLGYWCLDNSQNEDYVYVAGEENIIDKAETLGLLKVQGMGNHVTITETDLAKLPEKPEGDKR